MAGLVPPEVNDPFFLVAVDLPCNTKVCIRAVEYLPVDMLV